jgi:hypothetical protein
MPGIVHTFDQLHACDTCKQLKSFSVTGILESILKYQCKEFDSMVSTKKEPPCPEKMCL